MQMGKWTPEPENFPNQFQKELVNKKVAIFASSAAQAFIEYEKKAEEIENNRKYLEGKPAKYNLQPISMVIFGGVWDFNKMNVIFRKTQASFKPKIEAAGFKEIQLGLHDTRDWDAIRTWAKELAAKVA